MLKIGDKVVWGLIVPGLLTGLLLVLPYIEVGPSRRYGDRRIGLSLAALFVAAMAMLSFMGTPNYAVSTSPDQEAVAELLPQTRPGPLRSAPWEDLAYGSYAATAWGAAPNATLQDLLHEFYNVLTNVQSADRTNVAGVMVIEDWQTDLKKVTLRVTWTNVASGSAGEFSQSVYLHRNSNYGEGA
jgi:hypothetical protein